MKQFNQEHTDGRNSKGVLPNTLTASNIQVVSIAGDDTFGSYCSSIANKPGHSKCYNSVSETYLILIPYKMSVHKATTYDSIKFAVKASKKAEWKMDEHEKQYDRHESLNIEEPAEVSVKVGSENL